MISDDEFKIRSSLLNGAFRASVNLRDLRLSGQNKFRDQKIIVPNVFLCKRFQTEHEKTKDWLITMNKVIHSATLRISKGVVGWLVR